MIRLSSRLVWLPIDVEVNATANVHTIIDRARRVGAISKYDFVVIVAVATICAVAPLPPAKQEELKVEVYFNCLIRKPQIVDWYHHNTYDKDI